MVSIPAARGVIASVVLCGPICVLCFGGSRALLFSCSLSEFLNPALALLPYTALVRLLMLVCVHA